MSGTHSPAFSSGNYHKKFLIGTLLKAGLILIELYYGFYANSVALISDAFHNLGDSLGLLIAWGAYKTATLKPSNKFTFGLKNTTIIGAFINAILVFVAVGGICWEALLRLQQPEAISLYTVIMVASIGVVANAFISLMFLSGRHDINIWGAFIHLISDALVAVGVIIAALIIIFTDWLWVDPIVSILISVLILIGSWGLFKESTNLLLHAVPAHIELEKVKNFLLKQAGIQAVHDLHIWATSSTETAIAVHLVVTADVLTQTLLEAVIPRLEQDFGINHATIQIEQQPLKACAASCE